MAAPGSNQPNVDDAPAQSHGNIEPLKLMSDKQIFRYYSQYQPQEYTPGGPTPAPPEDLEPACCGCVPMECGVVWLIVIETFMLMVNIKWLIKWA